VENIGKETSSKTKKPNRIILKRIVETFFVKLIITTGIEHFSCVIYVFWYNSGHLFYQ